MKLLGITVALVLLSSASLEADEGMWTLPRS
jgi:hypothetical protein